MMQAYRGAFRTPYNHPDMVLHLSGHTSSLPHGLLAYFEERIRSGIVFRPDETVQVGFAIITLKSDNTGDFEVWEPSFQNMPIDWVTGADNTSRFILVRKETYAHIGVSAKFSSVLEIAVVARLY